MCKKGIAVVVESETGRISDIRIAKDEKSKPVAMFIGRNNVSGRIVEIEQVVPANNKAAKNLQKELENLNVPLSKNVRSGVKVCLQ